MPSTGSARPTGSRRAGNPARGPLVTGPCVETLHAERQVRDLCEALDAAEALLRHLDRMAAHYRLGWQMGAPFVDYDEVESWPSLHRPAPTPPNW